MAEFRRYPAIEGQRDWQRRQGEPVSDGASAFSSGEYRAPIAHAKSAHEGSAGREGEPRYGGQTEPRKGAAHAVYPHWGRRRSQDEAPRGASNDYRNHGNPYQARYAYSAPPQDFRSPERRQSMGRRAADHGREEFASPVGACEGHGGEAWSPTDEGSRPCRAPKGYKRSDERINEDLYTHLVRRTHIDASDVSINVNDGKVTLDGSVPERRMKHAIEDIAAACPGVTDVANHIRVSHPAQR